MVRATRILVLLISTALLSAACQGRQPTTGGDAAPTTTNAPTTTEASGAEGTVDVCQWFTQADAEAVLDPPVAQAKGSGGYGIGDCSYTSEGGDSVRIEAGTAEDYSSLATRYEDAEKISGVGQEAIWVSFFTTLNVKLNDDYFAAVILSKDDKELAIEIGKKVAAAAA